MKDFEDNNMCDKCGAMDVSLEYMPDSHTHGLCGDELIEERDYLSVTCNVCGYQWQKKPLRTNDEIDSKHKD